MHLPKASYLGSLKNMLDVWWTSCEGPSGKATSGTLDLLVGLRGSDTHPHADSYTGANLCGHDDVPWLQAF